MRAILLTTQLFCCWLPPQACIHNREFKPAELQERANRQLELDAYEPGMEEEEAGDEDGGEEDVY
jgi:hypothetical protein